MRDALDRHFAARYVFQARVGKYIADFLFRERNLIVEADGPSHYAARGRYKDMLRSTYLLRQGYRVVRFTNFEILNGLDDVIRQIAWALR